MRRLGMIGASYLAVLAAPAMAMGMMAATAPAASAAALSHAAAGRSPAAAAGRAAAPVSLMAAVRQSLGTSASARGYSQTAELTPSDAARGLSVGSSMALSASGTTALIGAPGLSGSQTGAAYVFTLRGSTWSQTARLTASDGAFSDHFGNSVALSASGTTALIGAPAHNSNAGAAYVFTLRGSTWSQTAELSDPDVTQFDSFGWSVALDAPGTTALIGTPGGGPAGVAYMYTLQGGTWSRTAKLTSSDAEPDDDFGNSVALSAGGTTALIGAPEFESSTRAGAAYVFMLRGGTWSQTAELTDPDPAPKDTFGYKVALSASGTTALIATPAGDSPTKAGAGYVFMLRGGTWSQTARLTASDAQPGDLFGSAVALSTGGTTALIGAADSSTAAEFAGAGYVFTLRGGTWSQTAELTSSDVQPGDEFGFAVALSAPGTTALIGAPDHNSFTGAAYVFTAGAG